eukprot:TRINITY_DN4626_c0_g1_i1.p2 TRINITY_DN4626_c0_g1~~TRINITY_DN4626_c0_g1_i1.p2  ORF type:complete len:285 (-),score=92.79 TRINITY_DN4626_c0_g1_i1:103-957(-)
MAQPQRRFRVNVLVDWSKAFVDEDGSFYCGATEAQKDAAAQVIGAADLVVYAVDVHTPKSAEFLPNGGVYPVHNLLLQDPSSARSSSCLLTAKLQRAVEQRLSMLGKDQAALTPRHVHFQDYQGAGSVPCPSFRREDVCKTFGVPEFGDKVRPIGAKLGYVVSPKCDFNGCSVRATQHYGSFPGVNNEDFNVFTCLNREYGLGEKLDITVTGVVLGICVYQTASNLRQLFPRANVTIVIDATKQLTGKQFGFEDEKIGEAAVRGMCAQLNVSVATSADYLKTTK